MHTHPTSVIALLQETFNPLAGDTLFEILGLCGRAWDTLPTVRVVIDDQIIAQPVADGVNPQRSARSVQQVAERRHPCVGLLGRRDGHLAVMHAGVGQHRAEAIVSVNRV
jgi:hypothetical protein